MMKKLTHINKQGRVHMVDVGMKPATQRRARAEGYLYMQPATLQLILEQRHNKGDVLGVARTAGIMAAKKTAELIPLCHPLPLTHIDIALTPNIKTNAIYCGVQTETTAQTGVEMEALTAVQITLLTVYDMCKAVDRQMKIDGVTLIEKSGGQSGHWQRDS